MRRNAGHKTTCARLFGGLPSFQKKFTPAPFFLQGFRPRSSIFTNRGIHRYDNHAPNLDLPVVVRSHGFRLSNAGFSQARWRRRIESGTIEVEVQVGIRDLQSETPRAPFAIFGTLKDPSKLPGAGVTKNPYVAAVKFVMEKSATARDIQNTAGEIVDELLKFRDDVRQAMPR